MTHPSYNSSASIILNYIFIVYAFSLPFSHIFPVFTAPYIMLTFWFFEGNLHKKIRQIYEIKAFRYLFLLFLLHVISLFWSEDLHEGVRILKIYFSIIVALFVFYTSIQSKYRKWILYGFLSAMFISEVIVYGVYFEFWHFEGVLPTNPSPFMHHISYSIFLAVTIFLLLWQILDRTLHPLLRILETLFLISSTINLFMNVGRTGQLGFAIAFFVFIIIYFKLSIKSFILTLSILLTLFYGAYEVSPNFQSRIHQAKQDIENILNKNYSGSWGLRIVMKKVGWEILQDHPLLGVGAGDVKKEFQAYLKNSNFPSGGFLSRLGHVHDQFFQIALQTGIIGLFIFVLFLYNLFRIHIDDPLAKAIYFAILTVFIVSFFTDMSIKKFSGHLFAFLLGYFLNFQISKESYEK